MTTIRTMMPCVLVSVVLSGCALETSPEPVDSDSSALRRCDDVDGDGICARRDNCPNHWNPRQADRDRDGIGNACDPDEGPVPIGVCGPRRERLIDNLEDGDIQLPNDGGSWFLFNDTTGTQSPLSAEGLVVPGGVGQSRFVARSSGEGFEIFGAGFGVAFGCAQDVRRFKGVTFKAKARGARSFFAEVPTLEGVQVDFGGRCTADCNDFYRVPFTLSDDDWQQCSFAFADLAQAGFGAPVALDLRIVTGVQFNIDLSQLPYDLKVDDLAFAEDSRTGCRPIRRHPGQHHRPFTPAH